MARQDFRMEGSHKLSAAQLQRQILESRRLRSEALWVGIRQFITEVRGRASLPQATASWHEETQTPAS